MRLVVLVLAAAMLLPAFSVAQIQSLAEETERKCARVLLYDSSAQGVTVHGVIQVDYGAPRWKPEYGDLLRGAKPGTRMRLGKDGWASLETNVPLVCGGTKIAVGRYYLALEIAEKGGDCNLVLLDPAVIRRDKIRAARTEQTRGGLEVPLQRIEPVDDEHVERLRIRLRGGESDATVLTLEMRWGSLQQNLVLQAVI